MTTEATARLDTDELQHRKLTILRILAQRLSDELEQLNRSLSAGGELDRADLYERTSSATRLAFIVEEEVEALER